MKAIVLNEYGDSSNFSEQDVATPEINADEILIKIYAYSFNPVDSAIRQGIMSNDEWKMPIILGCDAAGEVSEVGSNVTNFKVGDKVATNLGVTPNGTYSEYVASPENKAAKLPDNVSYKQGSAVALAGETAYQALNDALKIQPNEKLLIQGASGGVGHLAVQIAKNMGAYVAVTASSNHEEMLKDLGADKVIDYHEHKPSDVISDYDAVFDMVGQLDDGINVLKSNGRIDTIIGSFTDEQKSKVQTYNTFTNANSDTLTQLLTLVSDDKLVPVINKTVDFSANGVKEAQDQLDGHHTNGKIIGEVNS